MVICILDIVKQLNRKEDPMKRISIPCIGMIHLKALPTTANNQHSYEEIFLAAAHDLKTLEEAGFDAAIVENMFDIPYQLTIPQEVLISYTAIFARLQAIAKIPLGVNLQLTNHDEEMMIASLCNGAFIRAENFVETRISASGTLNPLAPKLLHAKKRYQSNVLIFADVAVKHTLPLVDQSIESLISQAIDACADAIILTGSATGHSPSLKDAVLYKSVAKDFPIFIGSGINESNVFDFLQIADGIIVGSSIKKDGIVENPIDPIRASKLIQATKR